MERFNVDYAKLIPTFEHYLKDKKEKDFTTMYIHYPYCAKKCNFCMYDTCIVKKDSPDKFIYDIEKQFQAVSDVFKDEKIVALYIGGGSPSLLPEEHLQKLFNLIEKYWNIDPEDNMFNIEMHAAQVTNKKIDILKNSFINRVSVGVQSLDEEVLRMNNRISCSKEHFICYREVNDCI